MDEMLRFSRSKQYCSSTVVRYSDFEDIDQGAHASGGMNKKTGVDEDDFLPREEKLAAHHQLPQVGIHDYQHEILKTWVQVRIERSPEAEPDGGRNIRSIFVYNSDTFVGNNCISTKFPNLRSELFYHGTTRGFAKNIIEQGIDLSMSDRYTDFSAGKGFYVTDDYGKACEWGRRKHEYYSKKISDWRTPADLRKPAVIVFKIDIDMTRNETHLNLKVNNVTNRKFWECIVSHFRHGERSPDVTRVLKGVKYIEGPVAFNKNLEGDKIPTPGGSRSFFQLCICDEGYAKKFGSLANIMCVIFITD